MAGGFPRKGVIQKRRRWKLQCLLEPSLQSHAPQYPIGLQVSSLQHGKGLRKGVDIRKQESWDTNLETGYQPVVKNI